MGPKGPQIEKPKAGFIILTSRRSAHLVNEVETSANEARSEAIRGGSISPGPLGRINRTDVFLEARFGQEGLILIAIKHRIENSHPSFVSFGQFPAKLGPETRSNGSGSKNGAERT